MSIRSQAIAQLYREDVSCVIVRNGEVLTSGLFGIKPLMQHLRVDRRFFEGAIIADKVIGKAAAMLLVDSGIAEIYGAVMSESAAELLKACGIPFGYGELVPMIENRTHDGMCPMEQTVLNLTEPADAFDALEITIAKLMQAKA